MCYNLIYFLLTYNQIPGLVFCRTYLKKRLIHDSNFPLSCYIDSGKMGLLKHYKVIIRYFVDVIVVLLLNYFFFFWVFLNMMIHILNTWKDSFIEICNQSHNTELCVNRWRHSLSTQKRFNPQHKCKENEKKEVLRILKISGLLLLSYS